MAVIKRKIALIEEDKVASEDNEVAETFMSYFETKSCFSWGKKKYYFETILENLGIDSKYMSMDPVSNDSETNIVKKCENHPFMKKNKEKPSRAFNFSIV